jgi:molybdate transport system ATP-binding protein
MVVEPAPSIEVALQQRTPIPLDAQFTCRPGELLALVGPSGSG